MTFKKICRRQILSGLLCLFSIWASNLVHFYFIESLSHLVLVILFRICFASICYLSLKVVFVVVSYRVIVFRIYLCQMSFHLFNYVFQLIVFLINHFVLFMSRN